jgi:hypothetical protein
MKCDGYEIATPDMVTIICLVNQVIALAHVPT